MCGVRGSFYYGFMWGIVFTATAIGWIVLVWFLYYSVHVV